MKKVLKVSLVIEDEDNPELYSASSEFAHHMTASDPHDQAENAVRAVEHQLRGMLFEAFRFEISRAQRGVG